MAVLVLSNFDAGSSTDTNEEFSTLDKLPHAHQYRIADC